MDRGQARSSLLTGAAALLLACALALALSQAAGRAAESGGWIGSSGDFHVDAGEALVHGVPRPEVSSAMPGFSVPHALLLHHAGTGARLLAQVLGLLAGGLLVFALGRLLHSGLCGAAAALLYASVIPAHLSSDRWLYTLLVLAAAVALARRAADPTPRRSLMLGLPLGMSLLTMSPLVLFPPVLALYERLRRRPLPPGWAKGMGLLVLACLLPLTLWAAMNWRTHGRFILFEEGRGRHNIYIGALGFVSTAANPGAILEDTGGQGLLSWAAREALGHPLRTLGACVRRLAYAASFHPFLYAAALAAAWFLRRREEHRQLTLLAAVFIGAHCLMAVEERYFEPVLPLLCALAASLLTAPLPASGGAGRFADAALGAVLAPIAAIQVYALGLTLAYPGRAARPDAVAAELARHPGDPWLWAASGERRLRTGDPQGAARDLSRALALDPGRMGSRQKYSWARLAQGGRGAKGWEVFPVGRTDEPQSLTQYAFRTLHHLRDNRLRQAREGLAMMRALRRGLPVFRTRADDARVQPRLDDAAARAFFENLLPFWPEGLRPLMRRRLERLLAEAPLEPGRLAGLWQAEAEAARRFGPKPEPQETQARAARRPADPRPRAAAPRSQAEAGSPSDGRGRQAVILQGQGRYREALKLLDGLVREQSRQARWRSDRGTVRMLLGRREEAVADWRRALELDCSFLPAALSLGSFYAASGRRAEAARLYTRALARESPAADRTLRLRIEAELAALQSQEGGR